MQISPQIGGLISIAVGLASGVYLLWTLIRQRASKRWPATRGEILESGIEEDSDGWAPHVRYAYAVGGKHYANERLYFHLATRSTEHDARRHLTPYPVGKTVSIYYNPLKPEDAVLDTRMPLWLPLFWLIFTTLMLVVGVEMWRD